MYLLSIKRILASAIMSVSLNAFSYDIICKDDNGKQNFALNFEKPLSSQISNKLGIKVVVLKGFYGEGNRFSFIVNSIQEINTNENQNLILSGFGQITLKSLSAPQKNILLKEISFKYNKLDNLLNMGSIELITSLNAQAETQKLEYLNCHFEIANNQKEIKIYSKILDSFKLRK